jgi:hypothetical protein
MDTALTLQGDMSLLKEAKQGEASAQVFTDLATASSFLPRLQLMTSSTELVKMGKFPINHFAMIAGQLVVDVGVTVDVLALAWRPKAMVTKDAVISVFDPTDPKFKETVALADVKDSGAMYGPEYLLWVPSQERFVTFFMCNKSLRREAPILYALLQAMKRATLNVKEAKNAQYKWMTVSVTECSANFTTPAIEEAAAVVKDFLNPPKQVIEVADAKEKAATAREQ